MSPARLGDLVKADVPRLGKIVKESGAKAELGWCAGAPQRRGP